MWHAADGSADKKEMKNYERHHDLRSELKRIWSCKYRIIVPIVRNSEQELQKIFGKTLDGCEL